MSYNLHNIDGVILPFDKTWNSIAISLSGGADSALLAYLLCSHAHSKMTVHIISHTRMWKTRPWQSHDSMRVFDWLTIKFTNLKLVRNIRVSLYIRYSVFKVIHFPKIYLD